MAVYVASLTLPYESCSARFVVYHSNSESMFSPVFDEDHELLAHMFAVEYSSSVFATCALKDYSERAQRELVTELHAFLNECYPDYQRSSAQLPAVWTEELRIDFNYDDEDPAPDASDLLNWYQDGDDRAGVAQRAFHAWRRAQVYKEYAK